MQMTLASKLVKDIKLLPIGTIVYQIQTKEPLMITGYKIDILNRANVTYYAEGDVHYGLYADLQDKNWFLSQSKCKKAEEALRKKDKKKNLEWYKKQVDFYDKLIAEDTA